MKINISLSSYISPASAIKQIKSLMVEKGFILKTVKGSITKSYFYKGRDIDDKTTERYILEYRLIPAEDSAIFSFIVLRKGSTVANSIVDIDRDDEHPEVKYNQILTYIKSTLK
jgi:hypothetical protein